MLLHVLWAFSLLVPCPDQTPTCSCMYSIQSSGGVVVVTISRLAMSRHVLLLRTASWVLCVASWVVQQQH
jgi:hypothetical protein